MVVPNPKRARPVVYTPRATVAEHARYALSGEPHVPAPMGLEFPHKAGSSACDPESRKWGYWYKRRAEDAREQAATRVPEDASADEFERAAGEDFAAKRGAKRWIEREEVCATSFQRRQERRKPKAAESLTRSRALHRAEAERQGIDLTSAEYRDSMIGRTVARNPEGRDCGGWDPNSPEGWGQCDPRTIPPSARHWPAAHARLHGGSLRGPDAMPTPNPKRMGDMLVLSDDEARRWREGIDPYATEAQRRAYNKLEDQAHAFAKQRGGRIDVISRYGHLYARRGPVENPPKKKGGGALEGQGGLFPEALERDPRQGLLLPTERERQAEAIRAHRERKQTVLFVQENPEPRSSGLGTAVVVVGAVALAALALLPSSSSSSSAPAPLTGTVAKRSGSLWSPGRRTRIVVEEGEDE